jgi:Arc/MetJ family transcription regulator
METRYTLLLDDEAVKAVERLQLSYGLETKADAYHLAIRVLSWVTDQRLDGYEIARSYSGDRLKDRDILQLPPMVIQDAK